MQFKRLVLAAIVGLMAVLVLTGCGRNTVASVNGSKITKDEFYKRLESMSIQGTPAGAVVLDQMIGEKLIEQLAKERGVEPTDEQVEEKLRLAKKRKILEAALKQGVSLEDFKKQLRTQQAGINLVIKGVKVSDAEVKKYYDQNKSAQFTQAEGTKIGAVICNSKDKIDQAYSQLKRNQDFSTVAMTLSDDQIARQSAGAIGWVTRDQQEVPPNIVTTAFKLKINTYSEPMRIELPDGRSQWIIVKALDRRPKTVWQFADVKTEIREAIAQMKARQQSDIESVMKKARENAKIKVKSDRYKGFETKKQEKKK